MDEEKKEGIKDIIKRLHDGENPDDLKQRFRELTGDCSPTEIAEAEEELVKEGMPMEEIHSLCDVHLAVFRESIGEIEIDAPDGHPVRILLEEHNTMLKLAEELRTIAKEIINASGFDSIGDEMRIIEDLVKHFREAENHYVREENVLFPYLEKHGVTQPPAIMWMEHDKIRAIKKDLISVFESAQEGNVQDFQKKLAESARQLSEMLSNHFFKENNILFPAAMDVINDSEWTDIRKEFDELGYCCFTPEQPSMQVCEKHTEPEEAEGGMISFETGNLSFEVVQGIFNSLPVDITFVDKDDTVRFFSESGGRIFPRSKAIIGRTVQNCHPDKSMHKVEQILSDFKAGTKNKAEFWINMNERLIYIRYFRVAGKDNEYLGCLEVTQDITDIKKIEGEKRLL